MSEIEEQQDPPAEDGEEVEAEPCNNPNKCENMQPIEVVDGWNNEACSVCDRSHRKG